MTAVVMEVSSHALAMGRVGGVRFAVGGYTNFGSDHLDFHADAADYFAAKARLFDGRCEVEVLNLDDPALRAAVQAGHGHLLGGRRPAATWWADRRRRRGVRPAVHRARPGRADRCPPGWRCPAGTTWPTRCWPSPRWSRPGSTRAAAARGGRLRRGARPAGAGQRAPAPVLGVVDYAHKPDAIVAALAALRELQRRAG